MTLKDLLRPFWHLVARWINFDLALTHYGHRVRIPVRNGLHVVSETEAYLLPLLEVLLAGRPGIFIDVGANVGQTLLKVKLTNPEVRYIGAEPNSACAAYLHTLITSNRFVNCQVVCCAIGIGADLEFLYSHGANHAVSSTTKAGRGDRFDNRARPVPIVRGDVLASALGGDETVAIPKVDVEGGEADVLRSFAATIASQKPYVLFEFLPIDTEFGFAVVDREAAQHRRGKAEVMRQLFTASGYAIYQILADGQIRAVPDFPEIPSHGFEEINFLASPHGDQHLLRQLEHAA